MPLSTRRHARNQVIFREVNERLRALADAVPDGKADYLCECGDVECAEKIELELSEYESVRARPKSFFIVPGHERLEVEDVTDELDTYIVVQKIVPLDETATQALAFTDEKWPSREL
jgi:hypothetical protein